MKNKYAALGLSIVLFLTVFLIGKGDILSLLDSSFNTASINDISAVESFYRGINLNGAAVTIDGNPWAGKDTASSYTFTGSPSLYTTALVNPATDIDHQKMLRSGVYNFAGSNVTVSNVPTGKYKVYLYIWEDTGSTISDFFVNGVKVASGVDSGIKGNWQKLGPWTTDVTGGQVRVNAITKNGDAVIFSGIEIWKVTPAKIPYVPEMPSGTFYRGIDLDGVGGSIDGHSWEGRGAPNVSTTGNTAQPANIAITSLIPYTDDVRANMIRNGVYKLTDANGGTKVTMTGVPAGIYSAYLYVAEDNYARASDVYLNGVKTSSFVSGPAGAWKRLSLGSATVTNGTIEIKSTTSDNDALIFSGFEVYKIGDVVPDVPTTTPVNLPPVTTATTDKTIILPTSSTTLTGTSSDPEGSSISTSWTKVSGPATPVITAPTSLSTSITGLTTAGTYVFRLTATDNLGATASDDVSVTVNPALVVVTATLPTVTTPTVSAPSITSTSATLGASVTSTGVTSTGAPATITARGTCYGTSPSPTTNCLAQGGTTTGTYTQLRTGLTASTTYYYRGYATNATGTAYSVDGTFTTPAEVVQIPEPVPNGANYPVKTSHPNAFKGIEISFTYQKGTDRVLVAGPGYEISQYTDNNNKTSALNIFFDHGHYGVFAARPLVQVHNLDSAPHQYVIKFDLQYISIKRDGVFIQETLNGLNIDYARLWIGNSITGLVLNPYIGQTNLVNNVGATVRFLDQSESFKPTTQYVWDGVVGSNSSPQTSMNAFAGYHVIDQIVFWVDSRNNKEYGIANTGYNENHYELAVFDTANPHKVIKVFGVIHDSRSGPTLNGGAGDNLVIADMKISGNNLNVTRRNGTTRSVDLSTVIPNGVCEFRCLKGPTWSRASALDTNNVYPDVSYPAIGKRSYTINGQIIGDGYGYVDPKVFPETTSTPRFADASNVFNFGPSPLFFNGATRQPYSYEKQRDGKVWLSDPSTFRVLRFAPNSNGALVFDGTFISYGPISYTTTVDKGNPTRVFNRFLEYQVDYRYPLDNSVAGNPGWKLVRNWETKGIPQSMLGFGDGLRSVVTVNGTTYGIVLAGGGWCGLVRLNNSTGLESLTGAGQLPCNGRLETDGTIIIRKDGAYRKQSFVNNTSLTLRTPPANDIAHTVNQNENFIRPLLDKIVVWRQSKDYYSYRLGVFSGVGTSTAILSAPSVPMLDGVGGVGNKSWSETGGMDTVGSDIFAAFRGEGWQEPWRYPGLGVGQAAQHYHYNSAGQFIGQFGIPSITGEETDYNAPASAGNVHSIDAVNVNGETFIYTNAEASTGVQRWRVVR